MAVHVSRVSPPHRATLPLTLIARAKRQPLTAATFESLVARAAAPLPVKDPRAHLHERLARFTLDNAHLCTPE